MTTHSVWWHDANRRWAGTFWLAVWLVSQLLAPWRAHAEWPMYRGPEGAGVSSERIRTDWNSSPPRLLWRTPLTNGLSSVSVSGGRVFTQVRRGGTEYCVVLDAASGRFLWTTNVGLASYPNGGVGDDDGPRSTPAVRGNKVYVLGSYLNLRCLDAVTGTNVWSKDLRSEFGGHVIPWQNAASPLLEGDLLILNCNATPRAILALRQDDGAVVWRLHDDAMTHATPVAATIQGVRQIIFITQVGVVSVLPGSGDVLWRFAYPYPRNLSTAASPAVELDRVFVSAAYNIGSAAAQVTRANDVWTATSLWNRRPSRMIHWSTPVMVEGYVYGLFGEDESAQLRCLDVQNGSDKWSNPAFGRGSTLLVDGKLLVCTEAGDVVLCEPVPDEYREIARFTAVNGRIWNSPAVSDGVLYVRGTTELAAYDIAPALPPALRVLATISTSGELIEFAVVNADGTPITPARAGRIMLVESDLAGAPSASWPTSNVLLTLQDGGLRGELAWPADGSQRFYAARED